jgi:predicted nucleotidyltransferase
MFNDVPTREFLLEALAQFIRAAAGVSGVTRIAVIGSLTTEKLSPKDADVLVTVRGDADLKRLARLGRKLKGKAQTRNLGADIFLADLAGHYIGRTCSFKECHPRSSCAGNSCGSGQWICDDLEVVRLSDHLIAEPPLEVWPTLVVRATLPADARRALTEEAHHAFFQGPA